MKRKSFHTMMIVLYVAMVCLVIGQLAGCKAEEMETPEILEITVGQPTFLSPQAYQNTASLAISGKGILAAFYPRPGKENVCCYRTSTDGGVTWEPELVAPPQLAGGAASVALSNGGLLKLLTNGSLFLGEDAFHSSEIEGAFKDGWFTLHSTFAWFNGDLTEYKAHPVQVYMPDAVAIKQPKLPVSSWPVFAKGKILQLPNGDLLAPMYGLFKGDIKSRVVLSLSSDQGYTWRYYATVAVDPIDQNTELPGQYLGLAEPSIALLPNERMICVMRTQYAHFPGEYRPLAVSWSDDLGKTWTEPELTEPHLMTISPTVQVLDNGVVACEYGRPGFHVAFSINEGHTWRDRISFSDLPEPAITGQFDMIKAGPNKLVVIGSNAEGIKVWPITVERVEAPRTHLSLKGRVLDQQGNPIVNAEVELSPNRYTTDDWLEKADPKLVSIPRLPYRSIQENKVYPTVATDADGVFYFDSVLLGEYILTVETEGFAPQYRNMKVEKLENNINQDFYLKPGRGIRVQVVDNFGDSVPGACVVLNKWHTHTDSEGFFHWSVENPPPQVETVVYKSYSTKYKDFKGTIRLSDIEQQPIILPLR